MVPPAEHPEPLKTVLDVDLKQYDSIWAAAGSSFAVFQLTPADRERLTRGRWLDLVERE